VADFLAMADEAMINVGELPPQLRTEMALNYVKRDLAMASELAIRRFIFKLLASADDLSDLASESEQPDADSAKDRNVTLEDEELTRIRAHAERTGLSLTEARISLIMTGALAIISVDRDDSSLIDDTQILPPRLSIVPPYGYDPGDIPDLGPPPASGH
jgi:hypothetical protein